MKIFVTGATGYIGYAVSSALAAAGHQVLGLVRTQEKGKSVSAIEVEPVYGSMSDPSSYAETARRCQVLVHCASEWSEKFHELDRLTTETLVKIAGESHHQRSIIYTSGVWLYGDTGDSVVDEASHLKPMPNVVPRVDTEKYVLTANKANVSTIVVRPGCVYGGSGSLTATWFESAVKDGAARIVGDGSFRWAMVHLQDLANFYVRAVEASYGGEIFNVTDRSRFTILECAQAASRAAGNEGKVQSVTLEEARKSMGALADCLIESACRLQQSSSVAELAAASRGVRGWCQPLLPGVERAFRNVKLTNVLDRLNAKNAIFA